MIAVVLVVAEVLQQRLPIPTVVLPNSGLGMAEGIVLWGFAGSFLAWLVVLQYLRSIVRISGGGIP